MSPSVFPEPEKFKPSRWLASEESGPIPEGQYQVAFSKGRRQCIGINLAYAELRFAIATIFRRFELELFDTSKADVEIVHDYFVGMPLMTSKGIRVRVLRELD